MGEGVAPRTAALASPAAATSPTLGAAAPTPMITVIVVVIMLGMVSGDVPAMAVPVRTRVAAAVPVVALLAEVLGPALQPPPLLVAPHRDEGLLDERDRVVRSVSRGIRP
ncbi:hypothetical protein ASE14_11330 [Agromyces sp. Root81]|nr:hypothetical protein ASE14_11330 [Agromyces sp. Root81]